jgi:hypothetical protein
MTMEPYHKIQCPCCSTELVVTHRGRYEDLTEHVSNPNGKPTLKDGYQCPNEWCVCHPHNINCTWIEDGDLFVSPPLDFKWTVAHQVIKKMSVTGRYYAINSWNDDYEELKELEKIHTRRYNICGLTIKVSKIYYRSKTGKPASNFLPKVEYIIGGSYVIPFWRMTSFQIRRFAHSYSKALEGKERDLDECYRIANSLPVFGEGKDDRFFSRLSSFLLRTFFPLGCKKINQLYGRKEKNSVR